MPHAKETQACLGFGHPSPILGFSQGPAQARQHQEEDSRDEEEDYGQGPGGSEARHDQHEQQG